MSEEVRYERIKAAAVLTIDRPAHRNAVDMATAAQLREGLRSFEADGDARVLVLRRRGEGLLRRLRPQIRRPRRR